MKHDLVSLRARNLIATSLKIVRCHKNIAIRKEHNLRYLYFKGPGTLLQSLLNGALPLIRYNYNERRSYISAYRILYCQENSQSERYLAIKTHQS